MRDLFESVWSEVQSAWRFRWIALIAAWIVCLLGWVVAFSIPGKYESHAKIFVDANSLLEPLLKGIAVENEVSSQTELVRRLLVSREQIERVVDSTGLAARARNQVERDALVNVTTKRIELTADTKSKFFTISYRDANPAISVAVVKSLLSTFIDQSVGGSRADAQTAQEFLKAQINENEELLTDAEAKLAAFKKKNVGFMPDQRGGYFERMQAEIQAKEQNERELRLALNRREELRRQLTSESGANDLATSAIDSRILDAQNRAQELLTRYTEAHPDVLSVQEQIRSLRAEKQSLRENGGGTVARAGANLAAQSLQIAFNQAEVEASSLRTQLSDRSQRIAELRRQVDVLPEVEAEFSRLNRDYGVIKAQYEALVQRLGTARITDDAGRSSESRLRVVEPPVQPLRPVSPNRQLLLAMVFFAGLFGALALAWLLSQLRPVVTTVGSIARITRADVLGTIRFASTVSDLQLEKRDRTKVIAGAAALTLIFGLTLVFAPRGAAIAQMVTSALGIS